MLDKNINSKIGNKKYSDKQKTILDESTLITTKDVFEKNTNWNKEKIEERKNLLIEELYGI